MAHQAPTCRVNYIGPQGFVTVQKGSVAQVNQTPAGRHVTVTLRVLESFQPLVFRLLRLTLLCTYYLSKPSVKAKRKTRVKYLL